MNKMDSIRTNQVTKLKSRWKKNGQAMADDPNRTLKMAIWIYLFFWIFEGALRKWVVPALSLPLLVVRDPIVLWLMIVSIRRGLLKFNIYLFGFLVLGILSAFTAMLLGHGNLGTAIYGARTIVLYFPMMFVMGSVFDHEDVIKMGKWILILAIPMTLLIGLQFYSPQSAWVNRGVGGDIEGAGFGGALGYFRPPGTFSFTNGTTSFYSLVAPFVIYFWLNPQKINRLILMGATGALLIAIPLSISRTLLFQVVLSVLFLLLAVSRNPKYFGKILLSAIGVILALIVLSRMSFFQTATDAFNERFASANKTEGGLEGVLGERFLGTLVKAVMGSADQSSFGYGIGSGTAVGADLLKYDKILITADFEWMREIAELGLMGLWLIIMRVGLATKVGFASFRKLGKKDMLPWLLMSVGFLMVTQGQLHQSTILGFVALVGGLWMASLRKPARSQIIKTANKNSRANVASGPMVKKNNLG
ncbi:MAG: rane protein [Ferruginibacter sp.]|nr:rane protein [Ferruginibacter sp.]